MHPDVQYKTLRAIHFAMLILLPPTYLLIAYMLGSDYYPPGGHNKFMLYVLLIIGAIEPAVAPMIGRLMITGAKKKHLEVSSIAGLFISINIIKLALIEAIYIYGLVVFLLSGDLMKMLYFYPIGIIWTAVYWPQRDKFDRFLRQYENE